MTTNIQGRELGQQSSRFKLDAQNDILDVEQQSPKPQRYFKPDAITASQRTIQHPKELAVNLQNLYINPATYRPEYNFYNYNRFKQTHAIPIIYKTPSIFLNGLHFELPIANIVSITKPVDTQTIKLVIQISKQDFQSAVGFDDILGVFQKIEEYNTEFFEKNSGKMDIKTSRTLKNTSPSSTQLLSLQHEKSPDKSPNRFKNPGTRRLEYQPFYELAGDSMLLTLEIKQPYLAKIIQSQYLTLTSKHITNQAEITEPVRQYIQQIEQLLEILNLEFFELKKKKIDINLAARPISIRLWIKCNMFGMDHMAQNKISMRWKVCYYEC